MRTLAVRFWILVCLIGLGVLPVLSQGGNRGTVEGFVTDASGAAFAAASVTLGDAAKGTQLTSMTDSAGSFVFPVVPSGSYTLRVEQQGFAANETQNVIVTVGAKISLTIPLRIASATEQVEVNTEVPVVDTTRTTVSESVNARAVAELPVNGRNFLDFTLLTPGVVRDVRAGELTFPGPPRAPHFPPLPLTANNHTP